MTIKSMWPLLLVAVTAHADEAGDRARAVHACKMALMMSAPGLAGSAKSYLCDADPTIAERIVTQNPAPPSGQAPPMQAFYVREESSGFNKICYYNRLGSVIAITLPSMQMCPQVLR